MSPAKSRQAIDSDNFSQLPVRQCTLRWPHGDGYACLFSAACPAVHSSASLYNDPLVTFLSCLSGSARFTCPALNPHDLTFFSAACPAVHAQYDFHMNCSLSAFLSCLSGSAPFPFHLNILKF
jgi:hypothetical protein